MTHEELTSEVAELKTALYSVGELAQTLVAELKATNDRLIYLLDTMQGTQYGQEAVIHALMTPVLLSNDRNLNMFQKVLDGNATTRRAELNEDSLGNFEKTIDNAQTMTQMLSS
jgi:hypothetical protein